MTATRVRLLRSPFLLLSFSLAAPALAGAAPTPTSPFEAELLVAFRAGSGALERQAALRDAGARAHGRVHVPPGRGRLRAPGLARVRVAGSLDAARARLLAHPAVEHVERNGRLRPSEVADDTYYLDGRTWGHYGDDAPSAVGPAGTTAEHGAQFEKAWARGHVGSSDVVVAVIDTGVQFDHPDLAPNAWVNPHDPPNGVDDDGNGYVDDVHGWDFFHDDATVHDGPADGHGTHVAGTIGAVGGDGYGVAGAAWNVRLLSLKFIGPEDGSTWDAIRAFDYLVDLKERHGTNVVVANCSWGGPDYSRLLHEAVLRAARAGILIVAAAGNEGWDLEEQPAFPPSFDTTQETLTQDAATHDAIVSVAAIDRAGALASWSNRGAESVDLGAPGVGIVSTLPEDRHGLSSGTSMAAPHVTGAIALLAAAMPGAGPEELRERILTATRPTDALAATTVTGGRLDVARALFGATPAEPGIARGTLADVRSGRLPLLDVPAADQLAWRDPTARAGDGATWFYRHEAPVTLSVRRVGDDIELTW